MCNRLYALLLLVVLVGCAWYRPDLDYGNQYVQPQPLDRMTRSVRLHQRLTVKMHGHRLSFSTIFEIGSDRSSLVIMNSFGNRMLSVSQFDGNLTVSRVIDRELPIDPRRLYVDLQLMVWPVLVVDTPYTVESVGSSKSHQTRTVLRDGREFITVSGVDEDSYDSTRTLNHHRDQYTLELRTLNVQYLSGESYQ